MSDGDITFCISMSTIPSRIQNINEVIENLNKQSLKPNKIFLNIPFYYKRFPNQDIKDKDIKRKLSNCKNLEIIRCHDYGPGTKILGAIKEIRKFDCVILVDDDHIYDNKMCEFFIEAFKREKINYSYYLNKIFNIKLAQCADGFLINTIFLDKIEKFYTKFVKNNMNMFLDDDLWLAIYLQKEKRTLIKNLMQDFKDKFNKDIIYKQNSNSTKDSLHLTVHKNGIFMNRRKIHKIEYIKYILRSLIAKI